MFASHARFTLTMAFSAWSNNFYHTTFFGTEPCCSKSFVCLCVRTRRKATHRNKVNV